MMMAVLATVALAGCRAKPVTVAEPGAGTGTNAVRQFLAAAKAQDLQAMSAVWGNDQSPVRDRVERQELERRLLIMMCHLRHDESRIGDSQPGEAGRLIHPVELERGTQSATSKFTVVKNKETGRWYVEVFEMEPLRGFCREMRSR